MQPNTPLIDFFDRVYRPLKLAGRRSAAKACRKAIDAMAASVGRIATLQELIQIDPPPPELVALRQYLVELGVSLAAPAKFREVVYRGEVILVPIGEPTPLEIEQRAAEIRLEWNEGEARARAGKERHAETTWLPPGCDQYAPTPHD